MVLDFNIKANSITGLFTQEQIDAKRAEKAQKAKIDVPIGTVANNTGVRPGLGIERQAKTFENMTPDEKNTAVKEYRAETMNRVDLGPFG